MRTPNIFQNRIDKNPVVGPQIIQQKISYNSITNSNQARRITNNDNSVYSNKIQNDSNNLRSHSPIRANGTYSIFSNTSETANYNQNQKRPLSQVLDIRSTKINNDDSLSVSVKTKDFSPNLNSKNNFGSSIRNENMSIKEQIENKNKYIRDLTANKMFLEETLTYLNNEFKNQIRADLKVKIFDKVLKSNLHYIYKHYENYKIKNGLNDAKKVLNNNLVKQKAETDQIKREINELDKKNKSLESDLMQSCNKLGLVPAQKKLIENVSKEDVENKLNQLISENNEIEKRIKSIQLFKDEELYKLQFISENKGRKLMEKRSAELVIQNYQSSNPNYIKLKNRVEAILTEINIKEQILKRKRTNKLNKKKETLLKNIQCLKF